LFIGNSSFSFRPNLLGAGRASHVVEIIEQVLDGYRLLIAHQDPDVGMPITPLLAEAIGPLCGSKRELCSRLARLWWSGRSAHAGKRAMERAFHQGYQGRSPWLVRTPDRKWNRAGIKV
jgi:hypothetical protein